MANDDIQGQVTDSSGNPIDGAEVYLFSQDNVNTVLQTTTDVNGNYIFENHPDGDGTSQQWYVTTSHTDVEQFTAYGKPYVSAQLSSAILDSGAYYGFEDEPADGGLPDGWEVVNAPDGQSVTTADSYAGSQSYRAHFTGSGEGRVRPSAQPFAEYYTNIGVQTWVKQIDTSASVDNAGLVVYEDGTLIARVYMYQGDLRILNGPYITSVDAGEWVRCAVTAVHPDTDTYDVSWETATDSGRETGVDTYNPVSNGWNEAQYRIYGDPSGHYFDEYRIDYEENLI